MTAEKAKLELVVRNDPKPTPERKHPPINDSTLIRLVCECGRSRIMTVRQAESHVCGCKK